VMVLAIDQPSRVLAPWMQQRDVTRAAFMTACNPLSAVVDEAENAEAMQRLRDWLGDAGFEWLEGEGRSRDGSHAEPSLLALGIDLAATHGLMRRFEQNAFLWIEADAVPRLVWTQGLHPDPSDLQ
jgi:hypothetical protein